MRFLSCVISFIVLPTLPSPSSAVCLRSLIAPPPPPPRKAQFRTSGGGGAAGATAVPLCVEHITVSKAKRRGLKWMGVGVGGLATVGIDSYNRWFAINP